jgi:hypothetical protein
MHTTVPHSLEVI